MYCKWNWSKLYLLCGFDVSNILGWDMHILLLLRCRSFICNVCRQRTLQIILPYMQQETQGYISHRCYELQKYSQYGAITEFPSYCTHLFPKPHNSQAGKLTIINSYIITSSLPVTISLPICPSRVLGGRGKFTVSNIKRLQTKFSTKFAKIQYIQLYIVNI